MRENIFKIVKPFRPSFQGLSHLNSQGTFPHISGIHCTNLIDHLNALVIMFSALSNFDFVTKFAVKNQNKETRKFMEAFDMKIQKR